MRFTLNRGPHQEPLIRIGDKGLPLEWARSVRHLGSYVSCNLSEEGEITKKRSDLFGRTNAMLGNLHGMPARVLVRVLDAHCCHLYGCQAWRLGDPAIRRMRTAFHRCLRRILRLPPPPTASYFRCWQHVSLSTTAFTVAARNRSAKCAELTMMLAC